LAEGDDPGYDWGNIASATGVLYPRSLVAYRDLTDGASNTYLLGEKRCLDEGYDWGDDQHAYLGHGLDTARYATREWPPAPDGPDTLPRSFGSAHPAGCYFAMADGAVRLIAYDIDPEIHRRHGHRADGL
jgi:hypothetical protein